jgi:hypothetical protein
MEHLCSHATVSKYCERWFAAMISSKELIQYRINRARESFAASKDLIKDG